MISLRTSVSTHTKLNNTRSLVYSFYVSYDVQFFISWLPYSSYLSAWLLLIVVYEFTVVPGRVSYLSASGLHFWYGCHLANYHYWCDSGWTKPIFLLIVGVSLSSSQDVFLLCCHFCAAATAAISAIKDNLFFFSKYFLRTCFFLRLGKWVRTTILFFFILTWNPHISWSTFWSFPS